MHTILPTAKVAIFAFSVATSFPGHANAASLMDKIMASWIGATLDEAFAQWGFPDEERKIAGRLIYVWLDGDGGIGDFANCERLLSINDKGIVIAVDSKGVNCPFMEVGPYAKWRKR
jgi:hypothetical protein